MAITLRFASYPPARCVVRLLACLCVAVICTLPHAVFAQELSATVASQSQAADTQPTQEAANSSEPFAPAQQDQQDQPGQAGEEAVPTDETRQMDEATTAAKPPAAQAKKIAVSVRLEGPNGVLAAVESVALQEGATAWDATKLALSRSGLNYRLGTDSAKDVIVSVDDPTELGGGAALKLDTETGNGWHLYLNAERYQGFASTAKLQDGDEVVWRYEVPSFEVSVAVVGPGGTKTEYWIAPTTISVRANQTAWDASNAVFAQNGFTTGRLISYVVGEDGAVRLESLAGLGENGITGESWQVFLNGMPAATDAAHVALHAGDSVCWYYVGNGASELPTFAEETGAASPNPVVGVRVEGRVAQAWTAPAAKKDLSLDPPGFGSGLVVLGGELPAVVAHDTLDTSFAIQTNVGDTWRRSMAKTLEKRIYTGQGGKATLAHDGSLYYVDGLGSLVKLEVRPER